VDVRVTVPYTALLGAGDLPGELAGYGPIPAAVARDLAASGTWRRILTDPASGRPLDYGISRYRPPAHLAGLVITRDQTCQFPAAGCRRIAAISTTASHMIQTRSFADTGIGPRSQTPLQPQRGYQTVARGDWAVRKYARPLIYPPMPLVCCIRVCQKGPTQAAAIRVRALDVR
jgi:hypothetical protein